MSILEVKNLSVSYDKEKVLEDISFALERGETMAIIGPNGSGKTTLFRAIISAIPFSGKIERGRDVRVGYVPQKIDLERDLPITVKEFLTLRSHAAPSGRWQTGHSPEAVLKMVDLSPTFLSKRIGELSSGELQRILIAWAITGHPDLLLFDEPTASVDVAGQRTVYELLRKLQEEHNLGLILISHDLTVVYRYASKVLCLNRKQICFGIPSEVLTPAELARLYGGDRKFYQHVHS